MIAVIWSHREVERRFHAPTLETLLSARPGVATSREGDHPGCSLRNSGTPLTARGAEPLSIQTGSSKIGILFVGDGIEERRSGAWRLVRLKRRSSTTESVVDK